MSTAIEIEAKVLISKYDYQGLSEAFKDHKPFTQTNYYIDSDDDYLHKEGIVLRIREKNGSYTMTLKTPLSTGLLEKNEPVSPEEFAAMRDQHLFPKNDLARFLTMLGVDIASLKLVTSLTTERIDIEFHDGLLSLDKNEYSGNVDYEVEFEYNNIKDAETIVSNLLKEHNIPCHFSKVSKVSRAMKAIGRY